MSTFLAVSVFSAGAICGATGAKGFCAWAGIGVGRTSIGGGGVLSMGGTIGAGLRTGGGVKGGIRSKGFLIPAGPPLLYPLLSLALAAAA